MCPEQPDRAPAPDPVYPRLQATPGYEMSHVVWLNEKHLVPGVKQPIHELKPHQTADVEIPSRKAYLFEMPSWCATGKQAELSRQLGYTATLPISVLMFDGSVRRIGMNDVPPTPWGTLPFIMTVHGVRGWDVPP